MNDPNGLIFHKGQYHLFYQHNPFANEFGNISWGHAVSKDLYHWEHLPVALPASEGKMIYSGCVVFDTENSLNHPKGPALVALYTEHKYSSETDYHQCIRHAISHNDGLTWDMNCPERLEHPATGDFRDPKVFWYEIEQKWVMTVALPKDFSILFYESKDLRNWTATGSFTAESPKNHYWECPDLFSLIDDHGVEHWVLTLSGDNPDGETWGMFYFMGEFDGKSFNSSSPHQWLNHGHDFYAGITFEGLSKKTMLAWCGNWAYAQRLPRKGWQGKMSLPRGLSLVNGSLYQRPLTSAIPIFDGVVFEPMIIKVGDDGTETELKITPSSIQIDRSGSSLFLDELSHSELSYSIKVNNALIYYEQGILEVFLNDGSFCITECLA